MVFRSRNIPPLKSLAAFEVAARSMSFADAARELNVTRVAVSRQVRQLEDFIGIQLFHRGHSDISLTSAGRRLYRVVSHGLQAIVDEVEAIANTSDSHLITLATTAGVSTYWLMPIIGRYREIEPSVDFRLLSSYTLIDLSRANVDVAIRYGDGDWPAVDSMLIAHQTIQPACSRAFLNRVGPIRSVAELASQPLLEYEAAADSSSFWPDYLKLHGIALTEPTRKSSYESYINFIQAVLDGHGFGLLGRPLMAQFFDSGVLVPAVDVAPTVQRGYFLCHPQDLPRSKVVTDFSDWLYDAMRTTACAASGQRTVSLP